MRKNESRPSAVDSSGGRIARTATDIFRSDVAVVGNTKAASRTLP